MRFTEILSKDSCPVCGQTPCNCTHVAESTQSLEEDLRKWFKEKWVRFGPNGKIRGDCARGDDSEGKPKCLPQAKAHALGKKGRASAAARKRREDPNPERRGPAKNVATKKKSNEGVAEGSEQSVSLKDMVDVVDRHYPKFYDKLSASDISDKQFEQQIINAYKKIMQKQGVAEGSLDDIEDTRQWKNAVALAKTQQAIRQAKDGKGAKYYADGTLVTPAEVARRAAERKAKKKGVAEDLWGPKDTLRSKILKLYKQGLEDYDIAYELDIDEETVADIIDDYDKKYRQRLLSKRGVAEGLNEVSANMLTLNHNKGNFASVVWHNSFDKPKIEYHNSLEDAIEHGAETSAWRNQAYAWNGKKWVRKYSATEPGAGSRGSYGSWYIESVAEGVTGPEIKQAYKDAMNTPPGTPERKSAVRKYQKLRADALDKKRKEQGVAEQQLDEKCWDGYHKEGNKELFGKTVPNCVKNESAVAETQQQCPECGGPIFPALILGEKQDACYYKVKSRYKVWPSAYASGALVQCRKKGAANWGNKK